MKTRAAKVWIWTLLGLVGLGASVLGVMYATFDPKVVPGQYVEGQELTGNKVAVSSQLSSWWESASVKPIKLTDNVFGEKVFETSLIKLGGTVDAKLFKPRYREFFADMVGLYDREKSVRVDLKPAVKFEIVSDQAAEFLKANHPEVGPARATMAGGKIKLQYEANSMTLDEARLGEVALAAYWSGETGEFPVKQAAKKVPDSELERITTVMSKFSTRFNGGQIARSSNIRLAASRINGLVLMPGETFSFNGFLGQRTTAKGFKTAGVYVSGRHDVDVGGGICQVSSTLYNAALQSDLKIDQRLPHSLPVPYVPLGRDAAVSYPNPDLKITNNYEFPIALAATPDKNSVAFAILGARKLEFEVKFESRLMASWSRGEKVIHDPSLGFGVRKVVDSGGSGRRVRTWKVVYRDGKEVERINLGDSVYSGGPRIIAMNRSAKAPAPKKPSAPAPVTSPEPATPAGD
jgi:vancomycin resistance protein YoaR